ncbi:hypothetical protein cyc_02924 [Cyclospora cayetanensis]|uniref:Uncharacterized protein n=1 Tax=Cyclospora cayetanensis TaxID=88456 RepID=A0A1D3D7R4_9EIME|nr:hypothetical protein cyc_02924 [Cyclospora cayetanensis]
MERKREANGQTYMHPPALLLSARLIRGGRGERGGGMGTFTALAPDLPSSPFACVFVLAAHGQLKAWLGAAQDTA